MATCVIYVPGLGDHRTYWQDKAIKLWRIFGLKARYLPLGWALEQGKDAKLDVLLGEIDRLRRQDRRIVLVGVSAGASAVLAAYRKRQDLEGVVLICGKVNNPQNIGRQVYQHNPDFKEFMASAGDDLDALKKKGLLGNVLSLAAVRDKTVPPADSVIAGAENKRLPGWSHVSGIFWGTILGGLQIARFLRNKP